MPKPTWTDKLQRSHSSQLKRIDKAFADIPEGALMFIATPQIIDTFVREIPPGSQVSLKALRSELAVRHKGEFTCPVTTGIFLRIVAEAAWEQHQQGSHLEQLAPFWRVVEPDSPLAKKLACGADFIRDQRKREALS
jgi:hypothetical protein